MKYSIFGCAMLMLLSLRPTIVQAELREWSSSDGKFKIEAEFVGFDADLVKLKKGDGTEIKVPADRLGAADLKYLESRKKKFPPAEEPKADLPTAVVRFRKSMESMRNVEARRLEKRIHELKRELDLAKKAKPAAPKVVAGKAPPGLEARMQKATIAVEMALRKEATAKAKANENKVDAPVRTLGQRLELVNSGKPFFPRLSPKDFAVGQIGELDDDFVLFMSKPGKDEARISVMFREWQCVSESMRGETVPMTRAWVSRPDSFYVRSEIVMPLANVENGFDNDSRTNRVLRKHFFEVVEKIPRGATSDYVLVPYQMDETLTWLKEEEAKRSIK